MKEQLVSDNSDVDDLRRSVLERALDTMKRLNWLVPTPALSGKKSTEFGRNIETTLNQIAESRHIIKLLLRRADKAVVLGIEEYESILDMKQQYERLIERVRELEIAQAGDRYDMLYRQIISPESRHAADSIADMSDDDLNQITLR